MGVFLGLETRFSTFTLQNRELGMNNLTIFLIYVGCCYVLAFFLLGVRGFIHRDKELSHEDFSGLLVHTIFAPITAPIYLLYGLGWLTASQLESWKFARGGVKSAPENHDCEQSLLDDYDERLSGRTQ